MNLGELLDELDAVAPAALDRATVITDIVVDSREVVPGALFVAIRGAVTDGHQHLAEAFARGAVAAVVSAEAPGDRLIRVEETGAVLAPLARRFFGDPSRSLRLLGVTGTNGKTTTCFLVRSILEAAGQPCALLGTVGYHIGAARIEAPNTTPDALLLNRLLARCRDAGIGSAVMEVSSHALALGRVAGLRFESAVFTNLTQDHLDFHRDMDDYFEAKARLFEMTGGRGAVNLADPRGRELRARHPRLLGFGDGGTVRAVDVALTINGTTFRLESPDAARDVTTRLIGRPNVENALAAAALATEIGIGPDAIAAGLAAAMPPPGRFETVPTGAGFTVAVDYAHTPDALERLLATGRDLGPRRLKVLFGCGGDRDRTKRPRMGAAASRLADEIWLTSDNPRTEDPERILDEIGAGITRPFRRFADRRAAIEDAVATLVDGDLLLVAGKGHEDYQIIGREKRPFDDRLVVAEALKK